MITNTVFSQLSDADAVLTICCASGSDFVVALERDEDGGGWVSIHGYERWMVQDWVRYARAVGITADEATDNDAPHVAWLYVGGEA